GNTSTINPGESLVCISSYTLTLEDADFGKVENVATATGVAWNIQGTNVNATGNHTQVLAQQAALSMSLTGTLKDVGLEGQADIGDTMEYIYTISNTGSVTLRDIGEHTTRSCAMCRGTW
ncbi:unnamed protein product, partial [Discosporangium mesarthrocarpum]